MSTARLALPVLLALATSPVFAAQQGSLGTTSTATYEITANGPVLPRLVQILNVSEVITTSTRAERVASSPGATASACVVDTYGGAVSLTVSNALANGNTADGWVLKASTGDTIIFRTEVTDMSNSAIYGGFQGGSNSFVARIPAGSTVSSSGSCGTGTIKLHDFFIGGQTMPETFPARSYTTITLVASSVRARTKRDA